jgi:hypothetical protein
MGSIELINIVGNTEDQAPLYVAENRWKIVDLGMVHTLLKILLKNVSDKVNCILTIFTSILISLSDTISDIVVAITLFAAHHHTWAIIVIVMDYLPGWTLAAHNYLSNKWKTTNVGVKEKVISIIFLIFSPFATALCHLRWLWHFESEDSELFDYLHHNSRLSQLLNGSYESPIQIVILFLLWATNKLEVPWSSVTCITDSINRKVCLGVVPGILSLTISTLSLMKGSLDVSEGRTWAEKFDVCVYSLCNYSFRLPSIALAILYFNEWSLICFVPILICNIVLFIRYSPDKRYDISVITSVITSVVNPFVISDQANIYQRTDIVNILSDPDSISKNRRQLSATISTVVSSFLIISDLVLFFLLKYEIEFKFNPDIIIDQQLTETILSTFLLPMGGIVLLCNIIYYVVTMPKRLEPGDYFEVVISTVLEALQTNLKSCLQKVAFLLVLITVISLLGYTANKILSNKDSINGTSSNVGK